MTSRSSVLIGFVVALAAGACAKRDALPGDSVSDDGSVTLSPPKPSLSPKPETSTSREPLGALERRLFAAELVMEHQAELGLDARQREALLSELERGQKEMVRLQWDLQGEKEKLVRVLDAARVDEAEARAAGQRVMERENKVKAAHLTMLVRVKNLLTPAQQAKLRALRGDGPEDVGAGDAGPTRDGGP